MTSPEFIADQKSEGLSNNLWSGGYNFYGVMISSLMAL
jgi:hypothetical protein